MHRTHRCQPSRPMQMLARGTNCSRSPASQEGWGWAGRGGLSLQRRHLELQTPSLTLGTFSAPRDLIGPNLCTPGGPFLFHLFKQMFIEHLLCARYKRSEDTLDRLTLGWGRETRSINPKILK